MAHELVHSTTTPLEVTGHGRIPTLFASDERLATRTLEFFAATIRNPNTRRAYLRAVDDFSTFCLARGISTLNCVQPLHVAAWVEDATRKHSAPTVKQRLAGLRMLFDWLVVGQAIPMNPASSVRGPKHSVKRGKTPVLDAASTRQLLDSIEADTVIGARDRALIGLMVFSFARIGAATSMSVGDFFYQGHRAWIRLLEKGGKVHEMPVHHTLNDLLEQYLSVAQLSDRSAPLFQSIVGRTGKLSGEALSPSNAWAMVQRRSRAAGLRTRIGNHTFRATGITEYLIAGGKLEVAQAMAGHESARTTGLYDRRPDLIALDEIERIRI